MEALTAELQRRAEEAKKGKAAAATAAATSQTTSSSPQAAHHLMDSTASLPDEVTASGHVLVNGPMNGHHDLQFQQKYDEGVDPETRAAAEVPLPEDREEQTEKESHINGEVLQPAAEVSRRVRLVSHHSSSILDSTV